MSQQPPEGTNYGVQQFGGQSQVANQAVGPGARATAGAISFQSLTADQRTVIDDTILVGVFVSIQQLVLWNYVKDFYQNGIFTDSPGAWTETWIDK